MAKFYVLPLAVVIDNTNNVIRFGENSGASVASATLSFGTYHVYGDGTEAGDLLTEIRTQLDASSPLGQTYTVALTSVLVEPASFCAYVTIIASAGDFVLLTTDGAHTFPSDVIGHSLTADSAFASGLLSTKSTSRTWVSNQPPTMIDVGSVSGMVAQDRTPQGQMHTFVTADPVERRTLGFSHVHESRAITNTLDPWRTFNYFWRHMRKGDPLRIYERETVATSIAGLSSADLVGTYVMTSPLETLTIDRDSRVPTYAWEIELVEYIA